MVSKSNLGIVTAQIIAKLQVLKDREYLLQPLCFDIIDKMTNRIHVDGKASNVSPIGTYSMGYMAIRTGVFKNSDV